MPPTKDEIKVIAQEVAEHYFGLMKEYVGKEIKLHIAQCAASKWGWFKSFLSGITGGVIVGIVVGITMWLINNPTR